MNRSAQALAARRLALVARIDGQRLALGILVDELRPPLAMLDFGVNVLGFCKRHPFAVVGSLLLLRAAPPARVTVWLERVWLLWRVARGASA